MSLLIRSRGSSVSTGTMLLAGWPGLITYWGKGGDFSLRHLVQTGYGTHPASYPMGTRGFYSGNKVAVAWSWPLTYT